jgi:hypothetical protein
VSGVSCVNRLATGREVYAVVEHTGLASSQRGEELKLHCELFGADAGGWVDNLEIMCVRSDKRPSDKELRRDLSDTGWCEDGNTHGN